MDRLRSGSLPPSPDRVAPDSDSDLDQDSDGESSDYSLVSSYDEQVANDLGDKSISISNSSGMNKSGLPSTNASQVVKADSHVKTDSKKELFREKKKTAEFNLLGNETETNPQKKPSAQAQPRIRFCMPRRSQFSKRISQTELTALQEIKNYSEYVH